MHVVPLNFVVKEKALGKQRQNPDGGCTKSFLVHSRHRELRNKTMATCSSSFEMKRNVLCGWKIRSVVSSFD